jgi:hypothetical protein
MSVFRLFSAPYGCPLLDMEETTVSYPHPFEAKVMCRGNSYSYHMHCKNGTWHGRDNCSGMSTPTIFVLLSLPEKWLVVAAPYNLAQLYSTLLCTAWEPASYYSKALPCMIFGLTFTQWFSAALIGCPALKVEKGRVWYYQNDDIHAAVIWCDGIGHQWHLECENNKWVGHQPNCTGRTFCTPLKTI